MTDCRVYPFTGLDYWTGILDWTTGLTFESKFNDNNVLVDCSTSPIVYSAPIPFSFEPLLRIMQQGLDCTPDQNSTSDLGGGGGIYSVLLCKDTISIGVGTGGAGAGGKFPPPPPHTHSLDRIYSLWTEYIACYIARIVLHKKFLMEFLALQLS